MLIATSPFGKTGQKPLELLKETGWEIVTNPLGRRLRSGEVEKLIQDFDAVIAGTEPYMINNIKNANKLKAICRVGIGLDNVDIGACKKMGIQVTYTPDAPSQGVAELTIANMINLARFVHESDRSVREGAWNRLMGVLLREITIGIIGVGRIGKIVIRLLQPFETKIVACDLEPDYDFGNEYNVEWLNKDELLKNADIISLHIPLNNRNHHYINRDTISKMKKGACLLNTSRGAVVDEVALVSALRHKHLGGAYLDVFEKEPYYGELTDMDNVILTAHIGSSARQCRYYMELGAAEDCIRVLKGEKPKNAAPESRD